MYAEEPKEKSKMDRLLDSIELQSPYPSKEHSAEKSFSRLRVRILTENNSIEIFRHRAQHYRIWLVAATVALLFAMSGWLYMMFEADPTFIVKSNHTGIVQDVILPDGTMIKLNNRSKLIYPESFSGDLREVFLEGEAYFEVAHNKERPFVVRAGELKIKVLGTAFAVNATSAMPQITATLLEGSIDVSDDRGHKLMKPNQRLTYHVGSGKMLLSDINNAKREIRWTQNVWVLTDTSLLEICQRLERQFNVKFIIMNDNLIGKSFTGEFYTSESLESILKIMQISTSFTYEQRGNNIILR